LPHAEDLISCLQGAQCFSKQNFHRGYHQHRVHLDSIEKTALICPDGLYERRVMPIGMANAPSEFMRFMTDHLSKHINNGYCIVFLGNIMIYYKDPKTHKKQVQAVLDSVRQEGFRLQKEVCQFGQAEAPFLRSMVNGNCVLMTTENITLITDWPDPA
jgi:hypothetical protein